MSDAEPPDATPAPRIPVQAVVRQIELDPERVASLYDRVGGEAWFVALVERFYATVERDPVLRPLYPEDLRAPKAHLAGFLVQYWGGPATYSERRGHPRLRMRHVRFAIGAAERDAWFEAMAAAVAGGGLAAADERLFLDYFDMAATSLINQDH